MERRPVRASALRNQYIHHGKNQKEKSEAPRGKIRSRGGPSAGVAGANEREEYEIERGDPWVELPDFNAMELSSLQKYRKAFKLPVSSNASREELVMAVESHFEQWEVQDDEEVLVNFLIAFSKQTQGNRQGSRQGRSTRLNRPR